MMQLKKWSELKHQKILYTKKFQTASNKSGIVVSSCVLGLIVLGCICAGWLTSKDPTYLDLQYYLVKPCAEFWFGTDSMGRDLFACIWYGGRISLLIGVVSTLISTVIGVLYGTLAGLVWNPVGDILMRLIEIFLSIPSLLLVIFIQAVLGDATVWSIAIVLGVTGWFGIAKLVQSEVRQIRSNEYVIASVCMGGRFFHILIKHLTPNFIPSIMFMIVMNVRSAMLSEATLSFMGLGLPIGTVSWGSMLSLAQNALMQKAWWVIIIPGVFLIVVVMCITNIGSAIRAHLNQMERTIM